VGSCGKSLGSASPRLRSGGRGGGERCRREIRFYDGLCFPYDAGGRGGPHANGDPTGGRHMDGDWGA